MVWDSFSVTLQIQTHQLLSLVPLLHASPLFHSPTVDVIYKATHTSGARSSVPDNNERDVFRLAVPLRPFMNSLRAADNARTSV